MEDQRVLLARLPASCLLRTYDLAPILREVRARVAASHPEFAVEYDQFLFYLAPIFERIERLDDARLLFFEDLYLAFACLEGDVAASAQFETNYIKVARAKIARVDASADFVDEVVQLLRVKLLVDNPRPRLATYRGRAPLAAWVGTAALRAAIDHQRKLKPRELDTSGVERFYVGVPRQASPDIVSRLELAIREAFTRLPSRTRAVMRMYYSDQAKFEDIARVYEVHATTVSRWLVSARHEMREATRALLAKELSVKNGEMDDVLDFAVDIDVTIRTLLRTPSENATP